LKIKRPWESEKNEKQPTRRKKDMSKIRSDSTWAKLTPEQREKLEDWLFEENLGYQKVLERVQQEFGVTASLGSVAEFYQRTARERAREELLTAQATAREIGETKVKWEELSRAAMRLVAKRMVQLAVESPAEVAELVTLGRLLVANEAQDTRRRWLELEERREKDKREEEMEWGRIVRQARAEQIMIKKSRDEKGKAEPSASEKA
jgi:hypothetical protein